MTTDPKITEQPADINAVHDVQVARLDADMFTADDIDGVTEGLSGSGNLNYLVLQSQQTNEAGRNIDPYAMPGSDFSSDDSGTPVDPRFLGEAGNGGFAGPYAFVSDLSDAVGLLNVDAPFSGDPAFGVPEGGAGGSSAAISSYSAGNFDSSIFNNSEFDFRRGGGNDGENGNNGNDGNGNNGTPGLAGNNGNNGNNGNDGRDGRDGKSPEPPPPPGPDDDVDLTVDVISDILDLDLDVILDPIENILGDIDIDIDAILGDILSTDDGILPNPTVIIDGLIGGVQLIDDLQLDIVLQPIETLLTDVIGAVNPVLGGLLPFLPSPLNLVGGILDGLNADGDTDLVLNVDLGLPDLLGLGGIGALGAHIPLDPVEMLLGDIDLDLSVESMLQDLLDGGLSVPAIDLALLSTGDVLPGLDAIIGTDTLIPDAVQLVEDLTGGLMNGDILGGGITGPVENLLDQVTGGLAGGDILGDLLGGDVIDNLTGGILGGDIADDLIGGDIVGDLLGGNADHAVGDLLGGILGGDGEDAPSTDTDLSVDTGIALADTLIDDIDLDVTLDPIENLVGDIDIDVNLNTDIVNDVLAGDVEGAVNEAIDTINNLIDIDIDLLNPEPGQDDGIGIDLGNVLGGGAIEDLLSWPETTISDTLGGGLGGVIPGGGGGLDAIAPVLPEPLGVISEGLGIVHDIIPGGGLGGGGGGGHGGLLGGLFG